MDNDGSGDNWWDDESVTNAPAPSDNGSGLGGFFSSFLDFATKGANVYSTVKGNGSNQNNQKKQQAQLAAQRKTVLQWVVIGVVALVVIGGAAFFLTRSKN